MNWKNLCSVFYKDQRDKEQNFGLKEGGPMDFKNWAQDNGNRIRATNLNVDDMEYVDCVMSIVDGNFLSKVLDISKISNCGKVPAAKSLRT